MVLRQLPQTEENAPGKPTLESVHLARQAVQLDVEDGTSWCECLDIMMYDLFLSSDWYICVCLFTVVLGNAYVSMFFACGQKAEFSQQALSAYAQAVSNQHWKSVLKSTSIPQLL